MNRRSSISGSLSTTNLSSPIAESTHINGSSVHTKLPWGGRLISPAKSLDVAAQRTTPKIQMSPINKIDPRMYMDVHSKGLVSRIVKYHENSGKLNRSLSTGNLYNKPGQFPVVHLKKKEITYKPNKNQSISIVRIAPPDKSIFQANTRSSILRTGSIVPTVATLQRGNEQISGENRPILHPAGNDIAPTRSVLDALREISRKRINSDELDCRDTIKKYCKEPDEISPYVRPTSAFSSSAMSKRQREGPSSPNSLTSTSPEQLSKKRLCSRNNDVTSSLSSSLAMVTPKRKFDDVQSHKSSEKTAKSDSPTPPKSKQLCYAANYAPLQKIEAVIKDQITPLPPTPAVEQTKQKESPIAPAPPPPPPLPTNEFKLQVGNEKPKPKLTLFNKNYDDASVVKIDNNIGNKFEDNALSGVTFVKPKNNSQVSWGNNPLIERTKKSKLALMLSGLSGELNEDEFDGDLKEARDLQAKTSITNNTEPAVSTTSPSPSPSPSPSAMSFETVTTASSMSFETVTTTTIATVTSEVQSSKQDHNTSKVVTMTSITFGTTPTPTATSTTIASSQSATSTKSATPPYGHVTLTPAISSSSALTSQTSISAGFTFGPPKIINTSSPSNTAASTLTSASLTSPALKSYAPNSASNTAITSTQSAPTFNFGTTSTPTSLLNSITSASSSTTAINTPKYNFASPLRTTNSAPTLAGPTTSSATTGNSVNPALNFNVVPQKATFDFTSSREGQTPNAMSNSSFGISTGNQPSLALGPNAGSVTITSVANQPFNSPQKHLPAFGPSSNSNSNFAPANSTFTTATKSPLSLTTESMKSPSNLFQTKPTGGFSFKPTSTTATNMNASSSSAPLTFSSALNQKSITTASSGFSFGGAASRPGGFSFAPATTVSSCSSVNSTSAPAFSFGGNNLKPSSGFAPSDASLDNKTTAPAPFAVPSQRAIAINSTFGTTTTETNPNPFSFGGAQAPNPTTATDGMFGTSKNDNKSNAFVFGSANSSHAATTTAGGVFNTATAASAHSVFGTPATTTGSSMFSTPATTKSSVFGAPVTSAVPVFGTSTAPTGSIPASNLNSPFGIATTTSNSVFGAPATMPPAFGALTSNSGSAFSSPAAENKSAAFVFGGSSVGNNSSAATKSYSFGGNTSTAAAPAGGFSFSTTNATENKNVFAAPNSSPNTFSFGATTSNNSNAKPVFGSSSSGTNTPAIAAPGSPFNKPSLSHSRRFNFADGSSNSTAPNPFAAAATTTANTKSETPFAFGAPTQQSATNNNNNSSQPFAFGAKSSSSSFAFNAASSNSTAGAADPNKTFTFGGSPPNHFGDNNSSTAFNFAVGASTNSTNSAAPNLFNVQPTPSATATAGDRIIRKAPRRLPKPCVLCVFIFG